MTTAVIHSMRVMFRQGSMSIFRLSSLMIRSSPLSVLFISRIVMLPISSAIRSTAVWTSGQSHSRV